jgi:hypothetical protein
MKKTSRGAARGASPKPAKRPSTPKPGKPAKPRRGPKDAPIQYLRRDRAEFAKQKKAKEPEPLPDEPPPERRERRALSHVGGRVQGFGGDENLRDALREALDVGPPPGNGEEDASRAHVHGFHSYAARLHPSTATTLLERLSAPGETILDPFTGSGTVLVEARILGRRAFGADLNPLSIDLAHLKTRGTTAEERTALLEASARVVEHAEERRISKAGPTERYGRHDLDLFDIHVLLELDGIRQGISYEPRGFAREALKLVLSSILVKVSKKPGDTVERIAPRRLASGFTIRTFGRKAEELARRLEEFSLLLPPGAPPVHVALDDARKLTTIKPGSVDLVLCSPPYPGVYDYAHHHAARLRWLGLDEKPFEQGEIGARRHTRALSRDDALDRWAEDFCAALRAIRRSLSREGAAVLVLADSVVHGKALFADDVIERLAGDSGLALEAAASQQRPHFHEPTKDAFARRARREHLFVLVPDGTR